MIRKMEVEDIAKILVTKDDDFKNLFDCSVGEWVQFLVQNAGNDRFLMIGNTQDDKIDGYLIAINSRSFPGDPFVTVIYSKTAGLEINKESLGILKAWAKEEGAKEIRFITNNEKGHQVYGFKRKAILMSMEL